MGKSEIKGLPIGVSPHSYLKNRPVRMIAVGMVNPHLEAFISIHLLEHSLTANCANADWLLSWSRWRGEYGAQLCLFVAQVGSNIAELFLVHAARDDWGEKPFE